MISVKRVLFAALMAISLAPAVSAQETGPAEAATAASQDVETRGLAFDVIASSLVNFLLVILGREVQVTNPR